MQDALLEEVASRLPSGQGLLLALSGGADSVALLHMLLTLQERLHLHIEAAHMEHGIRGEESLRDMEFVKKLCADCNVPVHTLRTDVPGYCKRTGKNLEQAARELRYAFLEKTRAQRGLDRIVLAHHADDQAETVLLHLIRGSALQGLCGMRAENGRLLRPLLSVPRVRILAYLRESGLTWREDATNADTEYSRNRLRMEAFPVLRRINPDASLAIARCAESLQEDETYLSLRARELLEQGLDENGLRLPLDAPKPLRLRALRQYLVLLGEGDIDRTKLVSLEELLFLRNGSRKSVGGRLFIRDGGYIRPYEREREFAVELTGPGEYLLPDGAVLSLEITQNDGDVRGTDTQQLFSLRETVFPLLARNRRPGDRLRPFGMNADKLLSDEFTDRHIPIWRRDRLPVIEKDGRILFVPSVRRSCLYPVTQADGPVLRIRYLQEKDTDKRE